MSFAIARHGVIAASRAARAASANYSTAVLADSPVGYWKMDETSGTTMVDSSGNGKNGTYGALAILNGSPLISTGRSISANTTGLALVASVPENAAFRLNTGSYGIELWIKTTSASGGRLCGKEQRGANWPAYLLEHDGAGGIHFQVYPNNGPSGVTNLTSTGSALNDGNPHHVFLRFDGTKQDMFIDGVLNASLTSSDHPYFNISSPTTWGCTYAGDAYDSLAFQGSIDECAIYNTALSDARILAHYNAR